MRFRFLLRPGWLALTLAVLLFAAACYTILAPWQFRRNAERVAQNAAVSSSLRTAPVPLDRLVSGSGEPAAVEWRPVTMTGHYLPSGEALARLRTVQGEPAYEVLTPFQLQRGGVVLLDRGYVRPVGDVSIPAFAAPPGGEVTVSARVRQDEPDNRPAFDRDGHRQVYAVNSAIVGQAAGLAIRPGYFELLADQPGVLNPLPLPQLDSGPFFSYALQWIAFGTMAILAWIYFTWRELQPGGVLTEHPAPSRRRSVAEMIAEEEAAERAERQAADEDARDRDRAHQRTG
ncbi:SURF1 family cytochrome oxidase biogenesis protein [Gandjariella thermophila]|uniref:SURF1-like protein n=1 Tax=Gandjariella thermophila TaxID=1931992 RepID=A0A4D4J8I0_9PSEU|nr:SURF1 family cytochrome oxidase biogenesis protein [Gandjariella thermophila]GDY33115.1 SURF1-like protein [Gandjariella thermophila]